MSVYRRALAYFRPFLQQTVFATILSFCGVGLNLLKPWPFKFIVDDILRPAAKGEPIHATLARFFGGASPGNMILSLCLLMEA